MEAQRIANANLAHQCARCTRSYPAMFRHESDGLVYCTVKNACREPLAQALVALVQIQAPPKVAAKRMTKKPVEKKTIKKVAAKKAATPRKRSRVRA